MAASDRKAKAATEIAAKVAEMTIQHLQFCMSASKDLRINMAGVVISGAGLARDAEQLAMGWGQNLAQVFLSGVDAQARVFAEATGLYRADMDGQRLGLEATKTAIEAFSATADRQYKAFTSSIEKYRADMDGQKLLLEGDKVKIEAFTNSVEAYYKQLQGTLALMDGKLKVADSKAGVRKSWIEAKTAQDGIATRLWDDVAGKRIAAQGQHVDLVQLKTGTVLEPYKEQVGMASKNAEIYAQVEVAVGHIMQGMLGALAHNAAALASALHGSASLTDSTTS